MIREVDIVEFEIKIGVKRRKMGLRCKVGGKRENFETVNKEELGKFKFIVVCSNDKFECSICGRIFDNKVLRDMYEDVE